jgi:hypothetical protein
MEDRIYSPEQDKISSERMSRETERLLAQRDRKRYLEELSELENKKGK